MECGGAQAIRPATALVAGDGSPIEVKRMTNSCGALAIGWATSLRSSAGDEGAPIQEKRMPKSGGAQSAASSSALPPRKSRVASRASGAPLEDKRRAAKKEDKKRTKSSGAQAVASLTALPPPPRQSRGSGYCAVTREERRTKGGAALPAGSSPAPPSRQSRVALQDKRGTKSAGTHVAASSAPPRQSRVALRADRARKEEKGSNITQVGASSTSHPPRRQSRATISCNGPLIQDKRTTTSSGPQSCTSIPPRQGRVALLPNGLPVDGVPRADVDRSIYKSTGSLAKIYRLYDTSETGLEAMMRSEPTDNCSPNWMSCGRHGPCTMMQIFSLKMAYPPSPVDQVEVYGFMAVRDTLDPLRNYVFNRTRGDPLIVDRENGLIQMSGPKRGIWWHDMALVEFDMRIKRGDKEADDLQLIDGAVWFNDRTSTHGTVATERIDGDYGSVDICYALLHNAMEATVQIAAAELLSGFSLCASAFYISALVHEEMQLFDGVIPGPPDGCHEIYKPDKWVLGSGGQFTSDPQKYLVSSGGRRRYEPEKCAEVAAGERYEVGKYVIAFPRGTKLGLTMKICQTGGSSDCDQVHRFCISPASTHGSDTFAFALGFATIHVKISWSTLQMIRSPISGKLLGRS